MKRTILGLVALALAGCATTTGQTPAQRLYEAFQGYLVAKTAAATYAEQPSTPKAVRLWLNNAAVAAKPTETYVRAYVACGGVNAGKVGGYDCVLFNFGNGTVLTQAAALRAAITALGRR